MAKGDKTIEPLDAEFDDVANSMVNPITNKPLSNNMLMPNSGGNSITQASPQLDLFIDKQKEIDGIGMGVLSDGTAFLNGRGLARLCGVNNARIVEMGQNWGIDTTNHMTNGVQKILSEKGISVATPYIEVNQRSGTFYAYPDAICLAVLEYYAFDAPTVRDEAKSNFRLLAGKALHDFIYTQVGYDPEHALPEKWKQFHDRVSLTYDSVPKGYFGVFKEIADMIVTLGQAGLHIDSSFVPDISVGQAWAKHWKANNLSAQFGDRVEWPHHYPDYFPQAASNPQKAWCYPEMALGEFRRWMRETYIGEGKFTNYVNNQVKKRALPASFAQLAIAAYTEED